LLTTDTGDEPLDIEHLREVLESRGYQMMQARMAVAYNATVDALIHCEDPHQTCRLQGKVAGLELAMSQIPQIILKELKELKAKRT
jgi:hypothetical protein